MKSDGLLKSRERKITSHPLRAPAVFMLYQIMCTAALLLKGCVGGKRGLCRCNSGVLVSVFDWI